MAKLTFKRREKKLLISRQQYVNVIKKISEHGMVYDSHCADGNLYTIYNLYFDDDSNSVIRRSISHPKFKEKLRVRAYSVPTCDDDTVYVEIKRKVCGTVVKRRACMSVSQAREFLRNGTRPDTNKYITNKVLDEIEYYLKCNPVQPKLVLSYDRVAFFDSADSNFRVTFDQNILTRRYDLDLSKGAYGDKLLDDDEVLMELKISNAIPKWFSDILADEKIYISGFSKYGNEYKRYRGHDYLHVKDRHLTAITMPPAAADRKQS